MAAITKIVTESDGLRKVAIPAYKLLARGMVFSPPPRVLSNSTPKTGTHLLSSLLKSFPDMMFSGHHYSLHNFELPGSPPATERGGEWELDWRRLERVLRSINDGQFMTAHFSPLPELKSLLDMLDYRIITMLRDPRDVAVSSAFYISRLERHFLHERFATELDTMDDRLMASIRGLPATERYRGLGSIGRRVSRYRQWVGDPKIYVCRFERLVGPRGGGNEEDQRAEIEAIAAHIDRRLPADELEQVARKAWSARSSTFRKGAIGDWRNHYSEEHKRAFKEVCGKQLIELGYERDDGW